MSDFDKNKVQEYCRQIKESECNTCNQVFSDFSEPMGLMTPGYITVEGGEDVVHWYQLALKATCKKCDKQIYLTAPFQFPIKCKNPQKIIELNIK